MSEPFVVHFHAGDETPIRVEAKAHEHDGSRYYTLTLGSLMRNVTVFMTPEFGERLAGELAGLGIREIVEREMEEEGSCP